MRRPPGRSRRQLIVLAKSPMAGHAKTRLNPPCTPDEAARLADAALRDTLSAVEHARADRRVVVLDGDPGPWLPSGFELIPQRGAGLDERLAAAFEDAGAPSLLIGMDTPQVTPELLDGALDELGRPEVDAVLGPTPDGGWWTIGLRRAEPRVFLGLPMSTPFTCARQVRRLAELGLRWSGLPSLRDVDRFEDAVAVAEAIPGSRFASAVGAVAAPLPVG